MSPSTPALATMLAAVGLVLEGCIPVPSCGHGSGKLATQFRNVSEFQELRVKSGITVEALGHNGSDFQVEVEDYENILHCLEASVLQGRSWGFPHGTHFQKQLVVRTTASNSRAKVTIRVPSVGSWAGCDSGGGLTGVYAEGGSSLVVDMVSGDGYSECSAPVEASAGSAISVLKGIQGVPRILVQNESKVSLGTFEMAGDTYITATNGSSVEGVQVRDYFNVEASGGSSISLNSSLAQRTCAAKSCSWTDGCPCTAQCSGAQSSVVVSELENITVRRVESGGCHVHFVTNPVPPPTSSTPTQPQPPPASPGLLLV